MLDDGEGRHSLLSCLMNNTKNVQSFYIYKTRMVNDQIEQEIGKPFNQNDHGLAFMQFCIEAEDLHQYPYADKGLWKPLQLAGLILELKVRMPCRDGVDKEPAQDLHWTHIKNIDSEVKHCVIDVFISDRENDPSCLIQVRLFYYKL